jgi:hypothetical protein
MVLRAHERRCEPLRTVLTPNIGSSPCASRAPVSPRPPQVTAQSPHKLFAPPHAVSRWGTLSEHRRGNLSDRQGVAIRIDTSLAASLIY